MGTNAHSPRLTRSTLHVLVTCSLEPSRHEILERVVENIKSTKVIDQSGLLVIDNGSKIVETKDLLKRNFENVIFLKENAGYWSAVDFALSQRAPYHKFVYVIESDEIHYAPEKLVDCELFMNLHPKYESVRTQEFSVELSHLYDKTRPQSESRRWAWTRLDSVFAQGRVSFDHVCDIGNSKFYQTELPPQVCAMNSVDFMVEAFDVLRSMRRFSEVDFQNVYFKRLGKTALIDGGTFNCKESFEKRNSMITGSFTEAAALEKVGYRQTRNDRIIAVKL